MPLRKFRYQPEADDHAGATLRLAADHDAVIVSPVHAMQQSLMALAENQPEPEITPYPGWFRVALPLVGSVSLWLAIAWTLGYLR